MRCLSAAIAASLTLHVPAEPVRLDGKTPEERGAAMVRYVASVKSDGSDAGSERASVGTTSVHVERVFEQLQHAVLVGSGTGFGIEAAQARAGGILPG